MYVLEFPNMNTALDGKDGESITLEESQNQNFYENLGWPFEYNPDGLFAFFWEKNSQYPILIKIISIAEFPYHEDTLDGKDGVDITIFEALEEDIYTSNGWDFIETWELYEPEGLTYYLPNLQDLEKSILDPIFLQPFLNIVNIIARYEDEILYTDQFVTAELGEFVIEAKNIKGYEPTRKLISVNFNEIGSNIDIVFEYRIAPPRLYDDDILSLQIASLDKKRERYKVQRRLLSGQYVTQTIDKGKDIYNIRFYSTEEQKRRLDNYYAAAQKIEYIKNLEITNLKIKKLDWNTYVNGNYQERIYEGHMEATEVGR